MSHYSMDWVLPRQVMFLQVEGRISGDDLLQLDNEIVTRLDRANCVSPVHFIEDVRGIINAPPLAVAFKLKIIRDTRLGQMISIGARRNPLLHLLYQSLAMTQRLKWRDVASLEQALQILNKLDPALPDLTGWTLTGDEITQLGGPPAATTETTTQIAEPVAVVATEEITQVAESVEASNVVGSPQEATVAASIGDDMREVAVAPAVSILDETMIQVAAPPDDLDGNNKEVS